MVALEMALSLWMRWEKSQDARRETCGSGCGGVSLVKKEVVVMVVVVVVDMIDTVS